LELHKLAERYMRGQAPEHTLQTTALVHEAYLKLAERAPRTREERSQFLAMASKAMRHVLVDHARGRNRQKRTAPGQKQPLDQITLAYEERAVDLLALHNALERLAGFDPQMAKLVELRFFGGLSMQECSEVMDEPLRTLERGWQTTRAWLAAEME
jgi:RNA polymerase sigma factor (TIGR02999 family)